MRNPYQNAKGSKLKQTEMNQEEQNKNRDGSYIPPKCGRGLMDEQQTAR